MINDGIFISTGISGTLENHFTCVINDPFLSVFLWGWVCLEFQKTFLGYMLEEDTMLLRLCCDWGILGCQIEQGLEWKAILHSLWVSMPVLIYASFNFTCDTICKRSKNIEAGVYNSFLCQFNFIFPSPAQQTKRCLIARQRRAMLELVNLDGKNILFYLLLMSNERCIISFHYKHRQPEFCPICRT